MIISTNLRKTHTIIVVIIVIVVVIVVIVDVRDEVHPRVGHDKHEAHVVDGAEGAGVPPS